ncbi:hypothetical protein J437_LFUL009224 [Ladona fulva]|uniref:Uncharacterized protein n=1 Tax=Ladona fulva TaxID=123851 RepID=A0A8K0K7V8_LADFU|nr:hypothetical protein J437_LFUL009224 [Ladona fulva]
MILIGCLQYKRGSCSCQSLIRLETEAWKLKPQATSKMRTALLFAIVLVVVASVTAEDGCHLVKCPPSMPGVHNVIPNPLDSCSFCCCRTGKPKHHECPANFGYDHGSRKCVRASECAK